MNNNLENVANKRDSKSKTWIIYVLVFLGSLDALYLTWTKLFSVDTLCLGAGKCDVVNASSYSTIAGVPIAALGLAMYLVIGGITLLSVLLLICVSYPDWQYLVYLSLDAYTRCG